MSVSCFLFFFCCRFLLRRRQLKILTILIITGLFLSFLTVQSTISPLLSLPPSLPIHSFPCSIEDAKQKAEHDKRMKMAEDKKLLVRRQISSLRRAFAKLQARNSALPAHLQLSKEEFVMDPDMEGNLKQQTQEKVELVHKELSWESEKHRIALNKLKAK